MKKSRFSIYATIGLLLSSFIFYSCGRCGGCDIVSTVNGAELSVNNSRVDLKESNGFAAITVKEVIKETKGDRNCHYKNLVVCPNDGLSVGKMTVKCDKELLLRDGAIPATKNLFEIKYVLDTLVSVKDAIPNIILRAGEKMAPGLYTFTIEGTTDDGKAIKDTATITWY